jgi:hypothetical protein
LAQFFHLLQADPRRNMERFNKQEKKVLMSIQVSRTDPTDRLRELLHYWFVQYNPLYFFSALCVLGGTFLVTKGLEKMAWEQGQIVLYAVIQSYELLLIVGMALLFRVAGQRRPAVILAILEVFFLFDPTFRTETIATLGTVGIVLSVAWAIMVMVKLIALAWIFRLKLSPSGFGIPVLAAVGLAITPHVLGMTGVDKETVHLFATWYAAGLVAYFLWKRPRVSLNIDIDQWGRTVLHRSVKAAWMIWAGFYLYHLLAWLVPFSLTLTLPHAAPVLLLLPFVSNKEISVWAGCLGAVAVTSAEPFTVSPTCLMASIVFCWQAWRIRSYRLLVGAIVTLHLAAWTIGWEGWPLPEPQLWLSMTTAAFLLVMAWRLQLPSALLAAIAAMLPAWKNLLPRDSIGWGVLLLAIGFLSLVVGVAIYWTQPRPQKLDGP